MLTCSQRRATHTGLCHRSRKAFAFGAARQVEALATVAAVYPKLDRCALDNRERRLLGPIGRLFGANALSGAHYIVLPKAQW